MASSPPSSDGFSANLSPRTAEPIANQHSATMDHLQQSLSSANSNLERVEHSLNDALINFMTIYTTNPVFYTSQASTVIHPPSLQHLETASMLAQTSRATIKANAPESASTLADAALIVVVGSRTSSMGARPVPAAPHHILRPSPKRSFTIMRSPPSGIESPDADSSRAAQSIAYQRSAARTELLHLLSKARSTRSLVFQLEQVLSNAMRNIDEMFEEIDQSWNNTVSSIVAESTSATALRIPFPDYTPVNYDTPLVYPLQKRARQQ